MPIGSTILIEESKVHSFIAWIILERPRMLGVSPEVDLLEEGHKLQGSREDGRLCLERLSQVVKTGAQETGY